MFKFVDVLVCVSECVSVLSYLVLCGMHVGVEPAGASASDWSKKFGMSSTSMVGRMKEEIKGLTEELFFVFARLEMGHLPQGCLGPLLNCPYFCL